MASNSSYWAAEPERSGFDPMEHARLDSSAFDPASFDSSFFVAPRIFNSPGGNLNFGFDQPYGNVAIAEPRAYSSYGAGGDFAAASSSAASTSLYPASGAPSSFSYDPRPSSSSSFQPQSAQESSASQHASTSANTYATPTTSISPQSTLAPAAYVPNGPVYAPYGSSLISLQPDSFASHKLPPDNSPAPPVFSPTALGLPPYPPSGTSTNFAGLYSSSGFDMLSVLARVASRPNPTLQIGPVDTSCSFLVVDARKWDLPIVFCSETFTRLTGYTSDEIIGRNCRFLQAPNGTVRAGEVRKYTDSHAVWHMRRHIVSGKESQSSLINYTKGGKAFINLVTIIPITWDNDNEIAYYVGFQVDLVDQPNAILDRMRDGTYVVNYSLLNQPPKSVSLLSSAPEEDDKDDNANGMDWDGEDEDRKVNIASALVAGVGAAGQSAATSGRSAVAPAPGMTADEVVNKVLNSVDGVKKLSDTEERALWNKFLLDKSDDFVHVLSLKGSILYSSPSAAKILEYQPQELVGKTLQGICHPSDVVPVMRELKDAGSVTHPRVSLLYRVQRKHSGYVWLEAEGKLHVEPGKGRKSVILVGRPRNVMSLSWMDLRREGGLAEREFWAKLSPMGMFLATTPTVANVLGFTSQDMVGTSIFQMVKMEDAAEVQRSILAARSGSTTKTRFRLKARKGSLDVITRFFASAGDATTVGKPDCIIAQFCPAHSHERKLAAPLALQAPEYPETEIATPAASDNSVEGGASLPFQSTFKTLIHPSGATDNVFDELDTTRCTSWQYELHQLQILNKKLRDEKDHLVAVHGPPPSPFVSRPGPPSRCGSEVSTSSSSRGRSCANCGRTDSPEWRAGPPTPTNPLGSKMLCNACGLRWAKSQKEAKNGSVGKGRSASTSGSGSDTGAGPMRSPTRSPSLSFTPYDLSGLSGSKSPSAFDASASPSNW